MQTQATAPSSASIDTVNVTATRAQPSGHSHFWAGDGFSFHDVLDAINPLQHLPLIGTLYRHLTGDTEGNVAEVVGDGIYGGVMGAVSGAVDVAVKEITGKDIGENLISWVFGDDKKAPDQPQQSQPAKTPAQTPGALPSGGSAGTPVANADPKAADTAVAAQATQSDTPAGRDTAVASAAAAAPAAAPLRGFMPIDTSDRGILKLKAVAATHNPAPVPLTLPPGTRLDTQAPPAAQPVDFIAKMREGLDKYQALMVSQKQPAAPSQSAIDQRL